MARHMPTRSEIEAREQKVLALAAGGSFASRDVREILGLNNDAANHLLKTMGEAGKLVRTGKSAGTRWHLPGALDPPPLRPPERQGADNNGADLQGRYVALLIERRPDRLMLLIEKGQVELTDEVLDAVEQVVFNERG